MRKFPHNKHRYEIHFNLHYQKRLSRKIGNEFARESTDRNYNVLTFFVSLRQSASFGSGAAHFKCAKGGPCVHSIETQLFIDLNWEDFYRSNMGRSMGLMRGARYFTGSPTAQVTASNMRPIILSSEECGLFATLGLFRWEYIIRRFLGL